MRFVYLLPFVLFACDRPLDLPGGEPFEQCPSAPGCTPSCASSVNAASCEQRSDCYVEYSLDQMCDSSGCASHFLACETGPVDCHVEVTCTIQPPPGSCDPGFTEIIGADGCSWYCVRATLCDPCAAHTDETSCENDSACHARFNGGYDCLSPPCPPGFTNCESGPAICNPGTPTPVSCTQTMQVCGDNFAPGYLDNGCPDGCVRSQDCPLSNGE